MDSVIDMNFSLSYRNEVLNFLLPLFPPLESKASHVYAVTRILVTLSNPSVTVPMLTKLIPKEKLLAYQLAFIDRFGFVLIIADVYRGGFPSTIPGWLKCVISPLRHQYRDDATVKEFVSSHENEV